jgi:hypothetical protein
MPLQSQLRFSRTLESHSQTSKNPRAHRLPLDAWMSLGSRARRNGERSSRISLIVRAPLIDPPRREMGGRSR